MLKHISGNFEVGCTIRIYDSESSEIFHPVVLKDQDGILFFEINQKHYQRGENQDFVERQCQTPQHPRTRCSIENILNASLSQADRSELFGALIDVVEDWLEEKGITPEQILNPERDEDNPAIIYGCDFDILADKFSAVLGVDRYGNGNKSNVVNLDNYVAYKLWTKEDIAAVLKEEGYEASEKNIADIINSGLLENLYDCTDSEWDIISQAATETMRRKETLLKGLCTDEQDIPELE